MTDPRLTPLEEKTLRFLREKIRTSGESPSFPEIQKHFGWKSPHMVTQYLKRLEAKKLILRGPSNSKRSIRLAGDHKKGILTLPLLGLITAGPLSEAFEDRSELIDVPEWILPSANGDYGCLRVRGSSMVERGIHDGDVVVFRKQATARSGQIIVASVDGLKTLKELVIAKDHVELKPYGAGMEPIVVKSTADFAIDGIYCGLLRKIRP
ncbi:MAG: repressor LexA [Spirochaetia bacterium]|nr:repressor LexA [Spirochaetia bacterium]